MDIGNGNIPLRIGNLINTVVHGGPYTRIPDDMFGVKMAVEIHQTCDVDIPTVDYQVPEVSDLRAGIIKALMAMINGEEVYAGCWGGIGRTGIFLAALAKVQIEYRKIKHRPGRGDDPVLYVRKHFIPHAVETDEQMQYIADFDVAPIVTWLAYTQAAMGLGGFTPPKAAPLNEARDRIEAMLDRSVPSGVILHESVAEEYKHQDTDEFNPMRYGGEGPEFDRYRADWKQRNGYVEEAQRDYSQDGHPEVLVEREVDWIDHPEADSAFAEKQNTEVSVEARLQRLEAGFDQVQDDIEILENNQEIVIESTDNRFSAVSQMFKNILGTENGLTKQPIGERIRKWLKEN